MLVDDRGAAVRELPRASEGPSGPPALGLRFLIALACVSALGPMTIALYIPALPAIKEELGVAVGLVQLTLSLSMVAALVWAAGTGVVADRLGRRPVLIANLYLFLAGAVCCTWAANIWVLVVGRALVGATSTGALVIGRAIINDVHRGAETPRAVATISVAPLVGFILAPLAGGVMTDALGWRSLFALLLALGAITVALVHTSLPETRAPARARTVAAGGPRPLLASPVFCSYALVLALHFAACLGFVAGGSYLVIEVMARSPSVFGVGVLVVNLGLLTGVLISRRHAERIGFARTVVLGSALACAGGVGVLAALFALTPSPVGLFATGTVVAVGMGLAMPTAQAAAVGVYPELAGTASGLAGLVQMLLAGACAQLVGVSRDDKQLGFWLMLATALAAALAASVVPLVRARRAGMAPSVLPS